MGMGSDNNLYSLDRALRSQQTDELAFGRIFTHDVLIVHGDVRIHYVIGGSGPAIVLLHGFPQHWREWRLIMPRLADAGYTVLAPDLRGFGLSDRPLAGHDVATVNEDVRQLTKHLGHPAVNVVGHDLGAAVAYAWAASHPDEVNRLVLMEALPAGLEPPGAQVPRLRGKGTWHLAFMSTPDIPEALISGREWTFVASLLRGGSYDPTTFSDTDVDAYAKSFAAPGGIRGAAAHIRAMPESAEINRRLSERKLPMPVLAIGGELSFGAGMLNGARQFAQDLVGAIAGRSGHWIPEERPAWLAEQIIRFLGQKTSSEPAPYEMSHQT
jgi:pimeloyl-ACP methyl ester carboxylesterase